ncbi:hypothetical protein BD311DRAFT_770492 [Dichomitus squalens]|uniref:Uncharacterized protein n=1 Tax=Dichomitus squalens TaxID=114155 RepID=A0A4Q9M9M0_9APHY|nr:hypothetical protein BD311DRAFT_770492 [Dichomitus squalens]
MAHSGVTRSYQQLLRSRGKVLATGVTATVAAFGTFWYAQRSYKAKKEESKSPAAIPTWEYRMTFQHQKTPRSLVRDKVPRCR